MPGVIIDGRVEIPPFHVDNYKDNPRLKLKPGEDMRARYTRWVRSICLHTTKGVRTSLKDGLGPDSNVEERLGRLWSTDKRNAGCHLSVDSDGSIGCHCDLLQDAAYHAGSLNEVSIGIEIYQEKGGGVYKGQLEMVVVLVEWLCLRFQIQRQMPHVDYRGTFRRLVQGGRDCVGVFGHRHQTLSRGPGDPGDEVFEMLEEIGYQQFEFHMNHDQTYWGQMQRGLGVLEDGVPGPATCGALLNTGHHNGVLIFCPDD